MPAAQSWILLSMALVLNAGGNILLKVGSAIGKANPLGEGASLMAKMLHFLNFATVLGIALFAANVLVYRKALDNLSISVAYPVMVSVGFILVTIAAVWIPMLSEKVTTWQIAGMALICIGVWLVVRG